MKFEDEYDEQNVGLPIVRMTAAASVFALIVLALVLYINREPSKASKNTAQNTKQEEETDTAQTKEPMDALERKMANGTLTADDLDFWDMYPEEAEEEKEQETEKTETKQPEVNDPATDGKHTLVVEDDGTEKWVSINPYLTKNEYDYAGLVYRKPIMSYYEEGKKTSYTGVSISKYNEFVDYIKLKKAGLDFAMIRVGARGYGTGQITLDENFDKNMKDAIGAGLEVGVYFFSQAVNEEEAIDEAGVVLAAISEYDVNYPIAFAMDFVENDTARVESLTREERTAVADAFLSLLKEEGYNTVLYADKEWLINKIDLSLLTSYDIWLSQEADVPDYPYKFSMWQYTKNAKVDGMAEAAELTISFIDYANK